MLSKKKNSKEEFWTSISEKLALKNWTESLKGIEKKTDQQRNIICWGKKDKIVMSIAKSQVDVYETIRKVSSVL